MECWVPPQNARTMYEKFPDDLFNPQSYTMVKRVPHLLIPQCLRLIEQILTEPDQLSGPNKLSFLTKLVS